MGYHMQLLYASSNILKQFLVSFPAYVGLIACPIVSFYTDGWEVLRSKKLRLGAFYRITSSVKIFLFH